MSNSHLLASIGSVYLETNYLAIDTAGKNSIEIGKEYRSPSYTVGLGGSAVNFAVQATALGLSVTLIGKVGDDEQGHKVIALLQKAHINSELVHTSKDVQTSIDTGIVLSHSGQNIQVVSGNANQTLALSDIPLNHASFKDIAAVYMGGYFKQDALYADYPTLLTSLKNMHKQIFLDHGRVPVANDPHKIEILKQSLQHVQGYFLNDTELLAVTGESIFKNAIEKVRTYGAEFVIIKMGERGCIVLRGDETQEISTQTVQALSTVGAGDAFNAGFLSKYLGGADIYTAAEYGNNVATYKVAHNLVVSPEMLDN